MNIAETIITLLIAAAVFAASEFGVFASIAMHLYAILNF